jgi:7-cyano-7-deazaguanine synthase in queuosine biosynthesis
MNALTTMKILRVAEAAPAGDKRVAVLGRDIRISSERIAKYCVTPYEPIYEDLATLVESMAYWDRKVVRRRSKGWTRDLMIHVPVYEQGQFLKPAIVDALTDAARFLTGDRWRLEFVPRKGPPPPRQSVLYLPRASIKHVVPFSDGLDSFAQVQLSVREHGREGVLLVRSGLRRDDVFPKLLSLRVPRRFGSGRLRETTYRTRPLVFYTLAAIGAVITQAESVVIGENGQGAFGPACLPFADEWWFRSAHPEFVQRWAKFLRLVVETPIKFEQPQLWKTKGEVLSSLRSEGLIGGWDLTNSCATRPKGRHGRHGCGVCGGCLLRTVSAQAAGLALPPGDNAFDVHALEDVVQGRDGRRKSMTPDERAVAVRAISAMAEFARLAGSPEGSAIVDREAWLVASAAPDAARAGLTRLLAQHKVEWDLFRESLPDGSWVGRIVEQL